MEKIVIWDDLTPPPISKYKTILWKSSAVDSSQINISKIVECNDMVLRNTYLSHIHDLGLLKIKNKTVIDYLELNKDFSFWWLTLFSQKCNFLKSEHISDTIKFIAFELWADANKFSCIELKTNNKDLYNCTKLWCENKKINFISSSDIADIEKTKKFKTILMATRSILNLFFYLIKRWNLKGHNVDLWKKSKGKITFFSYFTDNQINYNNKSFESNFWGGLPDKLETINKKTNWLHILAEDYNRKSIKKIKSTLDGYTNSSNQIHVTIDSFLSFSVLVTVIKEWIKILRKSNKLKNIFINQPTIYKKNYLLFFSEEDFYKSFYSFDGLSSILFFYLFRDATESLPIQDNGFFLHENQPWEIALTKAWKVNNHKNIIACPHSTIRFWDLRYYYSKETLDLQIDNKLPVIDFIATNGDHAFNKFLEIGYPQKKLVKVEALRYMYLNEIKKISRNKVLKRIDAMKILILGDYSKKSTITSIKLIQEALLNLSTDIELILKPHPACLITNSDIDLSNIKIINDPINNIINQCNIAFSCNVTSAALDVYFYDIPLICFHDLSKLNLSPVRGLDNIIFINSSTELRNILSNEIYFRSSDTSFNYFYLDKSLKRWTNLLQTKDIKSNIQHIK
jgi:surface carbohydrate biosynthesis protein (TIGR04326 family)